MPTLSLSYIKEKWQHAGFQKYFQNTSWGISARIFGMILGFFTTAMVARYLGPSKYGTLSYAVSFIGLFSFIAALGIDQILYRDLTKYPEKEKELLGTSFTLRTLGGILASISIFIFTLFFISDPLEQKLILIISISYIFQSFGVINFLFQSKVKVKYISYITIINVLIMSILKILIITFNKGLLYLGLILVLEPVLYAILNIFLYSKLYGNIKTWVFDPKLAKKMLKESLPLMLSTTFAIIYSRIDQIMLKNFIDVKAVGLYDSAVRLSEIWYFIPGIIIASVLPSIINSQNTNKKLYYERLIKLTIFLVSISTFIALIGTIFSKQILYITYGQEFTSAYTALRLYIWSGIGISFGSVIIQFLIAEKMTRVILYISLIGMIINIILNLLLIPRHGINGSAFATLVSYIIGPIFFLMFKKPRDKVLEALN